MRRIIFGKLTLSLFTVFLITPAWMAFSAQNIDMTPTASVTDELRRTVADSTDDAQQTVTDGDVLASAQYMELMLNWFQQRWGGAVRFPNITIPQGSEINSAYISVISYSTCWLGTYDSVACEDADNAFSFSTASGSYNISNRWANRTDAFLIWNEDMRNSSIQPDSTPDLKDLLQEVVNRPNWKSGNVVVFIFKNIKDSNDSAMFEFRTWEDHGFEESLFVNYTAGSITPNDTPAVSDIPNQNILEGVSFNEINLDDYVIDDEDNDSVIIWTHRGEVELSVVITNRVATVTAPDQEWNGSETIWFKACDPGGLCDSNQATFTVTAFNDTPVVSDIPNQTVAENVSFAAINLDNYVNDPDNHDSTISWTYRGQVHLSVLITNRAAAITSPDSEWNGSETIWFKACDPGGLCDSNQAAFTITRVNDPPKVADIRDTIVAEGESFGLIPLNNYVTDPDDNDSVMIWTHRGEVELLGVITNRVASVTAPYPEWNGSETIWFKACDPGGLCDSNQATFTVTAFNDTPVVSDIPNQTVEENVSFAAINLDNYVNDPDNHDSTISWTYRGQVHLSVLITNRVATVAVPDPEWSGSETIWFKACDPGGLCDSNPATFTVLSVNDAPVVSDIPDQTVGANGSFASLQLDNYVKDSDNQDSTIIWTYHGNVELSVDITNRVATVTTPDPDWDGFEAIWFKACDPSGLCDSNRAIFTVLVSGVTDEDTSLSGPLDFSLSQNHPNPFNSNTNITYSLSSPGRIKLTIYDLLGKRVKTLADESQTPGNKSFDWDGTDDRGNTVASGIYFYRLEAGPLSETKKMLLLK